MLAKTSAIPLQVLRSLMGPAAPYRFVQWNTARDDVAPIDREQHLLHAEGHCGFWNE